MRSNLKFLFYFVLNLSLFSAPILYGFDIPKKWEKSVVAIGEGKKRNTIGTGVLIKTDRYVLITAGHVIENQSADLAFWGNKINGQEYLKYFSEFTKKWPNIKWVSHPEGHDLAAIIVGVNLQEEDISFVDLDDFESAKNLKKGHEVYYLGFPGGIGAFYGSNPMLRKGIIALEQADLNKFFYIDATVAGGNSGGPVFTLKDDRTRFLGIVTAFEPAFTKDKYFYHTGIGIVYPVDSIKSLLESDEFKKTY